MVKWVAFESSPKVPSPTNTEGGRAPRLTRHNEETSENVVQRRELPLQALRQRNCSLRCAPFSTLSDFHQLLLYVVAPFHDPLMQLPLPNGRPHQEHTSSITTPEIFFAIEYISFMGSCENTVATHREQLYSHYYTLSIPSEMRFPSGDSEGIVAVVFGVTVLYSELLGRMKWRPNDGFLSKLSNCVLCCRHSRCRLLECAREERRLLQKATVRDFRASSVQARHIITLILQQPTVIPFTETFNKKNGDKDLYNRMTMNSVWVSRGVPVQRHTANTTPVASSAS